MIVKVRILRADSTMIVVRRIAGEEGANLGMNALMVVVLVKKVRNAVRLVVTKESVNMEMGVVLPLDFV